MAARLIVGTGGDENELLARSPRKRCPLLADQVVPGVWWLHGTRGSNVYALECLDGEIAIVDTGFASSATAIIREVRELFEGRSPSRILLTHAHFDHAGAAGALRREFGAEVFAGAGDTVLVDGHYRVRDTVGRTHFGRWVARLARRNRARELATAVDCPLAGEQAIAPALRAVPVPGHTAGSYCFVDDHRQVAFVGDLVISHGATPTRSMRFANADDEQYLRSMATFAQRAPAVGCPGHGAPLVGEFGMQLSRLASLPRRSAASPWLVVTRFRRMAGFVRRLWEQRRPL